MSLVDQELFLPLANSFANLDVCNLFKQANLAPFCRESASCPLGPYLNDVRTGGGTKSRQSKGGCVTFIV